MANGQIPASALGSVPGPNAGLLKPAALAYTAMHYASVKRYGVPLTIIDGSVGRTYRSYARQVLAKRTYGPNAATPGTSNHEALKPWVQQYGPLPVKSAKGRYEVRWAANQSGKGRRFGVHVPERSDRGPYDQKLRAAFKAAEASR